MLKAPRRMLLAAFLVTACASGPGPSFSPSHPPSDGPTGALAMCDDVPGIEAPAEWYRDAQIAMEGTESPGFVALTTWARGQPGFEELWIDRAAHNGWLTLAFSRDADARQQDLLTGGYANNKVVAVGVPWTMAQMEGLQRRVIDHLRFETQSVSASFYPQLGIVKAEINFLRPDLVQLLNEQFAGEPVCIDGVDPARAPSEGPQPIAGAGWRLLADQDRTGRSYWTGVGYDTASYLDLWAAAGLSGAPPEVDFESEIVIWFGAVHGSSCPRMRLDDVVVESDRPLVHAQLTYLDFGACSADALPHAYVVAFARALLPHGPFAVQLGAGDPPAGVPEERLIVGGDLSEPGAVVDASDLHRGGSIPPRP